MKFVLDMNLSPRWVPALEAAGYEAVHWSAVGASTAPDHEIMEFAAKANAVVITNDLDFGTLLAMTAASGPSVILIRADSTHPEVLAPLLLEGIASHSQEIDRGALLVLTESTRKLRILPLKNRPTH